MINYQFMISGKVQGVWYRKTVSENAKIKGFSGYVKNLDDGRVEAAASLKDDDALAAFIVILQEGSTGSDVEHIEQLSLSVEFTGEFEIR